MQNACTFASFGKHAFAEIHRRRWPCSAVAGVPAAPFYWPMVAVSGVSKTNSPELLAWADLHKITEEEALKNNRVIETGRGGRNRSF